MNNSQVSGIKVGGITAKEVRKGEQLVLAANGDQLWYRSNFVPSLDLRFAESKSLVDATTGTNLIDFTRASSGTYVGSDGLIKTATTNLLLRSEEFDDTAAWSNIVGTVARNANATTAPNGTVTADELVFAAADNTVAQSITVVSGISYAVSIWIKGTAGQTIRFTANSIPGGSNVTLTGDWTRYSFVGTSTGTSATLNISTYGGVTARNVFVWGAQLEQSSTVGEYVKTTSTINSAPRFDHDPTTGESLGLLVEEQRQNFVETSEPAAGASLAGTTSSLVSGIATPDGQVSIVREITLGNNTAYRFGSTALGTAGTIYTGSIWIRTVSGTGTVTLDVNDSSASSCNLTETWQRFDATGTNAINNWRFFDITGSSLSIYVWGAQLEQGSFPTSYIPTKGSTVTRAADVASISGSNFSSWYRQDEGTVFAEATPREFVGTNGVVSIDDDLGSERIQIRTGQNSGVLNFIIVDNGAIQVNSGTSNSGTLNKLSKYAAAYRINSFASCLDGGALTSGAGTVPTVTQLQIGIAEALSDSYFNAPIKRLTYWPSRLSNETLQAITQ